MQIARLSLFGVNEKCDVLHLDPPGGSQALRPEIAALPGYWLNITFFGLPVFTTLQMAFKAAQSPWSSSDRAIFRRG